MSRRCDEFLQLLTFVQCESVYLAQLSSPGQGHLRDAKVQALHHPPLQPDDSGIGMVRFGKRINRALCLSSLS